MKDRIIDAHNHPDWYGHTADKFVAEMDEYNIDQTWLLTWECPPIELDPSQYNVLNEQPYSGTIGPISFRRCLKYKEKYPTRFVLGYAPDPRRPEALDNLEAAIDLYDVKICGEIKLRILYDNPDALELFRFCGKRNMPVVLHFENPFPTNGKYPRRNYWYGGDMDTLERLLQKCPETNFLGHATGFWSGISGDELGSACLYPEGPIAPNGRLVQLLRKYDNLFCDISANSGFKALSRDKGFSKEFLAEFQDRIVYGRDSFGNKHQSLLEELNLPSEVRTKILFGNALKLIGEN